MKIKEQYLDTQLLNPLTGQLEVLRFLDKRLYKALSLSYPLYFEEEKDIKKK